MNVQGYIAYAYDRVAALDLVLTRPSRPGFVSVATGRREDGTLEWTDVEEYAVSPVPTLRLRRDEAEALIAAVREFSTAFPTDDWRGRYDEAKEALAVERARVDAMLGVVIPRA